VWEAIKRANSYWADPILYQRAGEIVVVNRDSGSLTVLSDHGLHAELGKRLRFYQEEQKKGKEVPDEKPKAVPPRLAAMLRAEAVKPLADLRRVSSRPLLSREGELLTRAGYYKQSATYVLNSSSIRVSCSPSSAEISEARSLIVDDLLVDFPFAKDSDLAGAVAMILQPFVREMIDGPCPLYFITKPVAGSGATLLAQVATYISTGSATAPMMDGGGEDEMRKRITSTLKEGPAAILIDNIDKGLKSASLASVLTTRIWQDRELGYSRQTRVPNDSLWIATGINTQLSTEIARRSVPISLEPDEDRPWERDGFLHEDLMAWVTANEANLVTAALTLISAWIVAGKPAGKNAPLGSFESASRVLGGILDVADINGFLQNRGDFYDDSDQEDRAWRSFVSGWAAEFGSTPTPAIQLVELAATHGLVDDSSATVSLGKQLEGVKGRAFGGWRIRRAKRKQQNRSLWYLNESGEGS